MLGIEIEGFWRDLAAARERAESLGMSGSSDGSLDSDDDDYSAWEFKTRPGSLGEAISQLIALYPDGQNSTAGMHVHVSFTDPCSITACYSVAFFDYFRQRWEAWGNRMSIPQDHLFWSRLRGSNSYCRLNGEGDIQSTNIERGDRYRQLNFTAWGGHKTLECRLLPLFRDLRIAISAVEELIAIYEDWLAVPRIAGETTVDTSAVGRGLPTVRHTEVVVNPQQAVLRGSSTLVLERPEPPPVPAGYRRYFGPYAEDRATDDIRQAIAEARAAAAA